MKHIISSHSFEFSLLTTVLYSALVPGVCQYDPVELLGEKRR